MIVRDFANGFSVADWTEELVYIPNSWGTIGQLGIFQEEGVAEHVVIFEEILQNGALIVDRVRGDRGNVGKDYSRKLHTFAVPHFPAVDYITPQDIQGKRAYGDPSSADTLDAVRMRKMERIRREHAWTLEAARAQAITAGTVYAPNGTVSQNWYSEFGKSLTTVDFTFGTSTADMISKGEAGIAAIQDNAGSSTQMTGVVALCSPTFFANLISHPSAKTAYQYFASTQDPLRNRLAPNGSAAAMHREFSYGGVLYVELRDAYNGVPLIPAGYAYMLPTGTDVFRTFFGPANKFALANTIGEPAYFFEYADPKGERIEIESESNFVNALYRPELVIALHSSN
ncbi:MAG: major capsid protein [Pseudomonadota bacterium]|nr:major capsid protein [Pseudomonadota bacterium]